MKRTLSLLLLLLTLTACSAPAAPAAEEEAVMESQPVVESADSVNLPDGALGTMDNPWLVGADDPSSVEVIVVNGGLFVIGDGEMQDYPDPTQRPWHSIIRSLDALNISGAHVGQNAFRDFGLDSEESTMFFLSDGIRSIGDSAFENAVIDDLNIPASVTEIGSRAFANVCVDRIFFGGKPVIAEDAFTGMTAFAHIISGTGWQETDKRSYGGQLDYVTEYNFSYTMMVDGEERGFGTYTLTEGDLFTFNAMDEVSEDECQFLHYELVDGSIPLFQPEEPVIELTMKENVTVAVYYKSKQQ